MNQILLILLVTLFWMFCRCKILPCQQVGGGQFCFMDKDCGTDYTCYLRPGNKVGACIPKKEEDVLTPVINYPEALKHKKHPFVGGAYHPGSKYITADSEANLYGEGIACHYNFQCQNGLVCDREHLYQNGVCRFPKDSLFQE